MPPPFPLRYLMWALIAPIALTHAQPYGLTSRPVVGPYLDGAMPAQPPVIGTDWTTVVAFPNLTFLNPMGILPMPGTNQLVVWEREGRIYHFENTPSVTNSQRTLVADFSNICQGWDDCGLLGIAFHPKFSLASEVGSNRFLYVYYNHVRPDEPVQGSPTNRPVPFYPTINRLSRITLGANGVALPESELVIIDQYDNSIWHNGGGMFFHPADGFLYLTNGDDVDTANSNRLDLSLFSGVLRIDVDRQGGNISHPPPKRPANEVSPNWPQYFIPNNNPFVGVPNTLEEFFAVGLRSPHRMTLDPPTGRIFIGDVGSNLREEITAIEPSDPSGLNLQWGQIEGYGGDLTAPYIGINKRPIIDYPHGDDGNAVIGGYIYRGTAFPELVGKYLFADNGSNRIWYLDESTHSQTTPASKILLAIMPKGTGPNSGNDYTGISSFGHDAENEIYICQLSSNGGKIYNLQRGSPPQGSPLPATLSATGVFSDTENLIPSTKLIPYTLNHPFWSDAAVKTRWASLPSSTTVGFAPTGEWTWPEGSVLVKHFELPIDDTNPALRKRLETRLIVKNANGVYGATYKWRADNQDADIIDTAFTENIPVKIAPLGPFTYTDVGSPALAGSSTRTDDLVTITAAGSGISGSTDQFHFAHQQRTGNFDLAVKVTSLTNSNINTIAGIMARESIASDSRHVIALVFPNNNPRPEGTGGYLWKSRETSGGPTTTIYPGVPSPQVNYPNTWVRLQRIGNLFIGSSSSDGIRWKEFARQQVSLPPTIYLGLAATSGDVTVPTSAEFQLETTRLQPWYYPSRSDCMTCHSQSAGGILGPKTRQLNGNLAYPNGVTDNQLRAWSHVGIFENPPPEANLPNLAALVALDHPSASLEQRARSYLDSNCASCHRPGGSASQSIWDARYDTPLAQQGILYGQLTEKLGDPTACVIVPQDLSRSMLYRRMSILGPNQMPPLAKNKVDTAGVGLMEEWINSLAANSPPLVTLISPTDGIVFNQSDTITLNATATDLNGIRRVEYYDGNLKIAEVKSPPYSFVWAGARRGSHQIYALAVDNTGNTGASARSNITIQSTPVIGWEHTDIGDTRVPGDAIYHSSNGSYTLQGSGNDIWGTSDSLHYLYQEISGNTMLTARITNFESPEVWAKAGVMLRETTAPGSKYSFSLINATYSAHQQSRSFTDDGSEITNGPWVGIPRWLRLIRTGDDFSTYHSPDGITWTLLRSETIPMNATILAGLAVTSHNNSFLNQATFDNVSIVTPNVNPTAGFRAEYYDNPDFTNPILVRTDPTIDFNWGEGSPDPSIDSDSYSVRWSGYLTPPSSGLYDITAETDDGVRVWLNGQPIIAQWVNQGPTRSSANVYLSSNGPNHIVIEYFQGGGGATARLFWKNAAGDEEIIPSNRVSVPPINAEPTMSLVSPLAGSKSLTTDTLTLIANATDSDGTIARVEFWADGVKLGQQNTAPYEWSWSGPRSPGQHSLVAIGVDNHGATTTTLPVQIETIPLALQAVGMQSTIDPPATTFTVRTTLPAGRNYLIEWSSDLKDWNPLQSATSTGSVIEAIQETTGSDQRFYRLRVRN